jgi:hypothetical protein
MIFSTTLTIALAFTATFNYALPILEDLPFGNSTAPIAPSNPDSSPNELNGWQKAAVIAAAGTVIVGTGIYGIIQNIQKKQREKELAEVKNRLESVKKDLAKQTEDLDKLLKSSLLESADISEKNSKISLSAEAATAGEKDFRLPNRAA